MPFCVLNLLVDPIGIALMRGRSGHVGMVVGFTTIYAISSYHN